MTLVQVMKEVARLGAPVAITGFVIRALYSLLEPSKTPQKLQASRRFCFGWL